MGDVELSRNEFYFKVNKKEMELFYKKYKVENITSRNDETDEE